MGGFWVSYFWSACSYFSSLKKYGKLSYLYLFFRFFLPISIFIFQTRKIVHTSNFAVVFDMYVPPPGIIKKWRWNSRHSGSPCTPDSFFRFVSLVGSGGAPPLTSPLATEHTHTLLSDKAGWLWFFRCRIAGNSARRTGGYSVFYSFNIITLLVQSS